MEGTKAVTGTISQISRASNEQASAIAQVTQGTDQISSVVRTNSAAASEELPGQAQAFKGLVGRFRLGDTAAPVRAAAPVAGKYE